MDKIDDRISLCLPDKMARRSKGRERERETGAMTERQTCGGRER